MCNVNPEHIKNMIYKNIKKLLYPKVLWAIYGFTESSLSWYELVTNTLVSNGFKINPYERCVKNKTINDKQRTIDFYVEDNKISHKDLNFITDIIDILREHFGYLMLYRRKDHTFLGMNTSMI